MSQRASSLKLALAGMAVVCMHRFTQMQMVHRSLSSSHQLSIVNETSLRVRRNNRKERASFSNPEAYTTMVLDQLSRSQIKTNHNSNRQKKQKKTNQRKPKKKPQPLQVPLPIFVPSLPKSGTTTTHRYFQCGGHNSAHLIAKNTRSGPQRIGRCVQQNVAKGRPPFANCGDYDVWTDTGYVDAKYKKNRKLTKDRLECYYPLIDALDEVYTSHPNATLLFVVRDTDSWLNSIQHYQDGFIMELWARCNTTGFPGREGQLEDFRTFYDWHKSLIRTFATEHPSMTYVEVDLEAPNTGEILKEQIGIAAGCWGHHNKNINALASDTE